MLSAEHITKQYGDRNILHAVNLAIAPGTITGLIGPSGAGKTTLLQILSSVDTMHTGTVMIDECESASSNSTVPSPVVALVFQQLFLWPHLTLRENITLANRSTEMEIDELISAFEMQDFIDRYPNETSLGQRQRAALARAIALKPRYLLLDEVTSALDIKQIEVLARYLEKLKKEGTGILLVTHLIPFATRVSDHILFMDQGKIIERGGKELIRHPKEHKTKEFLRYF